MLLLNGQMYRLNAHFFRIFIFHNRTNRYDARVQTRIAKEGAAIARVGGCVCVCVHEFVYVCLCIFESIIRFYIRIVLVTYPCALR